MRLIILLVFCLLLFALFASQVQTASPEWRYSVVVGDVVKGE